MERSWIRWSGVDGPGQSFDNGVVWVDDPAFAFLVKDSSVVLVQQGHGVFLTARGVFGGGAPRKKREDEGMGVFGELPGVVNNASKFAMIVVLVVGDAYALGKKARVVGKVECAREEAALS